MRFTVDFLTQTLGLVEIFTFDYLISHKVLVDATSVLHLVDFGFSFLVRVFHRVVERISFFFSELL